MDVFDLRNALVGDYASFIRSFIEIRDPAIRAKVETALDGGLLWPEPLIQLNPAFERGESVDELVAQGLLHPECSRIFRRDKSEANPQGKPLLLHRHQADAVRTASRGENYVLTTGTGSGKSLSYIVPVVDHVLRRGSGRGVQAVVVYPMNALANSQAGELEKFLKRGYPNGKGPVTFRRYTGQESKEDREQILANPPDILLTNYVMLELLLTRPFEKQLIESARDLRFLVFDELHTYRGRQGADVAFLIRRVRTRMGGENLRCIGTSATMSSEGTSEDRRRVVSEVASRLFGAQVRPEHVIGETLRRATPALDFAVPEGRNALAARLRNPPAPPTGYEAFVADPLSSWIETTFGIREESGTGRLVRTLPRSISGKGGAAGELSALTGLGADQCARAIQQALLAGYAIRHPVTDFPAFAFRVHQFISRGDTVWATFEPEGERYVAVRGQQFKPGDRSKRLLPLAFCRECGQEFYTVSRTKNDQGATAFVPRELSDRTGEVGGLPGFLYFDTSNPWPTDETSAIERLPGDWLEDDGPRAAVRDAVRKLLPDTLSVGPDGLAASTGLQAQFFEAPFRFCPSCGVSYNARQSSDFGKLSTLGSEGRSTATTILSLSTIAQLRKDPRLEDRARKLLSFTDNRQDASLQAGHFNDFVEVGLLRAAVHRACAEAGSEGISHDKLTQAVFTALAMPLEQFAQNPNAKYAARAQTERAMRDVLGYRVYRDLRRGWRVTSPNLEQCGLLEIRYQDLEEVAKDAAWNTCHAALSVAEPATRARIARVLLDHLRRELAIKVEYLDQTQQEQIEQRSRQHLLAPWGLDENERLEFAPAAFPRSRRPGDNRGNVFVSARSSFGSFLRRAGTFPEFRGKLTLKDTEQLILELFQVLNDPGGFLEKAGEPGGGDADAGYQLQAAAMVWSAGSGERAFHDPIRVPNAPENGGRVNRFFADFYRERARGLVGMRAREHTAQVESGKRLEREEAFREGRLPVLYCSPTMELGVDISELNVVNLRNVPPTPANYAQRSGRAGRSGQPALVFSYCSSGSPHDQYFFNHPDRMVAGAVAPPRLDLSNEELVRAHIHAVWLSETGLYLGASLQDVLDVSGPSPTLELLPSVKEAIGREAPREEALRKARALMETMREDLARADWYSDRWLEDELRHVDSRFGRATERWKGLYRAALRQRNVHDQVVADPTKSAFDRQEAERLRREAEAQIHLLASSENSTQSDFYSYRYFAGEGFLPGYNFPRLPLSAFIPGRRLKAKDDAYLSRPRFLAISEFGPRSFVYHEGSRYLIHKVILPMTEDGVLTRSAKQCERCGYLHPVSKEPGKDTLERCESCGAQLPPAMTSLFRLQNVATRRRDRISSDEEERLRLGFELKTAVRFDERDGVRRARKAEAFGPGRATAAEMTYGHAATLWRLNMGWTRRKADAKPGFLLDTERGYWAKNELAVDDDGPEAPEGLNKRVIPYVEDTRNCLLLKPAVELTEGQMASLQAALKTAIRLEFQLEENELAAEPLPSANERKLLLFYESAEGGAGVLRRLTEEPKALARVARTALALCHFDPDTGEERQGPEVAERCEAACYDCLMSYGNQRDHDLLDRKTILAALLALRDAAVEVAPTAASSRAAHLQALLRAAGSDLERRWLEEVQRRGLSLPTAAQRFIASCQTCPDFFYEEGGNRVAVYVDGPHHTFPERKARDQKQEAALEDQGILVVRFAAEEDWSKRFAEFPDIFGRRA